ncbi:MAG TPA: glycosyltransferase family A protein [Lacibacter sp.]|nr:glycosyltransferase family A protein [Lacibacter sp.]HMO88666.1 glycosyltransferase family A protein [Lacibacter sp.]
MTPIRISVLMTAYNRERYIAEAIESVLVQDYPHFELIIVDDGSKDNTVEIAQGYSGRDTRVRLFRNESNLGDYPNRNKAASYATGDLLMYVDSDDSILPDALSYIISQFQLNPHAGYATIYKGQIFQPPLVLSSEEAVRTHLFRESFLHIGPGGTVIRRNLFQKLGGFPEKYGPANDMHYNIYTACHTPVLLLAYNYLNYREHEGQEKNNSFGYLYNTYLYFSDLMQLPELPLTDEERSYHIRKCKRRYLVNSLKFLRKSKSLPKMLESGRLAGFGFRDILTAIFQR